MSEAFGEAQLATVERHLPESVVASRGVAVRRVLQGGGSILGALGLGSAYGILGLPLLPAALTVVVLTGGGLVQLGRAAGHFRRFGSTAALVGFSAAGGLGLSLTALNVLNILAYYGVSAPSWIFMGLGATTLGLAGIALLVVLRAVILWAVDSSTNEPEQASQAGLGL